MPILEQLRLEEALLRLDGGNWCLVNEAIPPAIVMGISGKMDELVDQTKAQTLNIPVIKRFSGGGTVILDEDTFCVSFLFNKECHAFPAYPEPILKWSEGFYQEALGIDGFHLKENDYVIGAKKCGGNAQYIKKDRWLHHTSFLWDFQSQRMECLLYPKKTPSYRMGRGHDDFLCRLKEYLPSKEMFPARLKSALAGCYDLQEASLEETLSLVRLPHRQTTQQYSSW